MANEDLLRKVADELEIRNIIAKAAVLSDTVGDLDQFLGQYIQLFSEDCGWIFHPEPGEPPAFPPLKGHAEIIAGAKQRRRDRVTGPGTHFFHNILTCTVDVQGDRATATSYLLFLGNTDTKPEPHTFKV